MMPQYPRYKTFPYPVVDCSKDKVLTVQSSRDEVDINKIVSRMERGLAVPVMKGQPFYGDVSGFSGLQDAIIKVQESRELFAQYPADVRARFNNDPLKLVEFLSDGKNLDEAVKLGLAVKRPEGVSGVDSPPAAPPSPPA